MEVLVLDLGHLPEADYTADAAVRAAFIKAIQQKDSPVTLALTSNKQLKEIEDAAEYIRGNYEQVLVLGIGGSALGARAIMSFIYGPFYNLNPQGPQLFILDNLDPLLVRETEACLDFSRTCLIYVSKSGSTPETAALFMYFSEKIRAARGNLEDVFIICDVGDNGINHLGRNNGSHLLHLPSRLPGRYSVLSAAGLLPAAIAGIPVSELLSGAELVQKSFDNPKDNPILLLGERLYGLMTTGGKGIHVLFNYASTLADFGLWFMQLWAESLGKKYNRAEEIIHAGSTPLSCVGATDQHSLLQLFKEGTADKVYGLIGIKDSGADLIIPEVFSSEHEYAYLAGHSLSEQLAVEQMSTQISLINTGHPCYQLTLAQQSPRCLGALFYFYQVLVAYMAELWNVNAFDQPGVEEGKQITYSLLGRADYQTHHDWHAQQVEKYRNRCTLYHL